MYIVRFSVVKLTQLSEKKKSYIENKQSTSTELMVHISYKLFNLIKTVDNQYLMKHHTVCCYCFVNVSSPCLLKEYDLIYLK
jgi:hypothetical protein